MTNENLIPATPLQSIALSCSGGGYRAASFHLGTMAYLHRLQYKGRPLLENVKMISTVSGGTITGAVYALQKQEGRSFEEIYHFLLDTLSKLDLVKMGIGKLNPDGQWNSHHKRKNLINAFAELYDQYFTNGKTLAAFDEMKSHLQAVAFNSIEFNSAVNFRFRNKGTGVVGNRNHPVPDDVAGEIRVADAIAASSCFPGGFEPIMWPGDFAHDNAVELKDKMEQNLVKPAGLLDGGIFDNQGIDSILLYAKAKKTNFDLLIISDVSSPFMPAFKAFVDQPKTGWRNTTVNEFVQKVKGFNRRIGCYLFGGIAAFALLPLSWKYANNWGTGLCIGISFSILMLWIGKMVLVHKARKVIKNVWNYIGQIVKKGNLEFYVDRLSKLDVGKLSVRRVEPLLMDRLNSLFLLMKSAFLKIVRKLNYARVFEDEDLQYRRISNLIYELREEDFTTSSKHSFLKVLKGAYQDVVGKEIKEVVTEASKFGTTLWFTDQAQLDKMLDKLVATGQISMCYNMIYYLEEVMFKPDSGYEHLAEEEKEMLQSIYDKCVEDWMLFKKEPLFLLKEMEY